MALGDSKASNLNAGFKTLDLTDPGEGVVPVGPKPTVEGEWRPEGVGKENEGGWRPEGVGKENEGEWRPEGVGKENEDGKGNDGGGDAPEASNVQLFGETLKKKKKKRKSKGSRKFPSPTGFEDNIVDGPLTLDIASLESELYSPSKSFSERIESCIQCYRSKRKFDPIRLQIFTTYLNIGGISTGPKAFSGGIDLKNNGDVDTETLQKMAATDFVNDKDESDGEWEVDFEYVARGFLSHKVPYGLGYMRFEDLELSAKVVRNFLNYIIYHNVCPEYNFSIRAALAITELAEKELILCRQVSSRLPGKFNMACSTLYDGYYSGMKDETLTWNAGPAADVGLTNKEASEILTACLESRGSASQKEVGLGMTLVAAEFLSLEVREIVFPEASRVKTPLPAHIQEDIDSGVIKRNPDVPAVAEPKGYKCGGLDGLGKLLVKVWVPEDQVSPDTKLDEFEIWLEVGVLQYCFVGMHLEAKVHIMSSGVIWIDSVTSVQCSFYLYLDSPEKESDDEFD